MRITSPSINVTRRSALPESWPEAQKRQDQLSLRLSDRHHYAPVQTLEAYRKKHKADPRIFSFDLQGYGTLQFPERNVSCLAGFSDKTMETLKYLDSDKQALIREIEAVEL